MTTSTPPRGPLASAGFALWHATQRWRAALGEALAPHGLTHTQFFLLGSVMWLSRTGTPPSQRQIADHVGVDAMTTSQSLRTLVARKLVHRRDDPDDTRAFRIALTAEGQRTARAAAAAVRAAEARFFAPLGDELEEFRSTLQALAVHGGSAARLFAPHKETDHG
jgi:DNA-binding MarR family transcriptional regulator